MAANQNHIRPSRRQASGGTPVAGGITLLVGRRGPARISVPVPSPRLGTAPIQKPPSQNFYRAGEYCPQVDIGKTTRDSGHRTLIGRYDNGWRWKYA